MDQVQPYLTDKGFVNKQGQLRLVTAMLFLRNGENVWKTES